MCSALARWALSRVNGYQSTSYSDLAAAVYVSAHLPNAFLWQRKNEEYKSLMTRYYTIVRSLLSSVGSGPVLGMKWWPEPCAAGWYAVVFAPSGRGFAVEKRVACRHLGVHIVVV